MLAKPKPTSNPLPSSSTEQNPIHKRNWIDIEPQEHMPKDAQDDGIAQTRNSSSRRRWSNWIRVIQDGFQINIQGGSWENLVDPSLLDNVLIPDNFFEFVYHVGSYFNMHSISASELIAGGKNHGRCRQTVFFTAVDPMDKKWIDKGQHDLRKPTHAAYKKPGKYVKMQDIGLIFVVPKEWDWNSSKQGRMRSFSMTLFRRYALKEWYPGKPEEVWYTKFLKSPRLAPTIPFRANLQKDWNSDAAAGSNSSQQTQPNQLANTEQPVVF